MKGTPGFLLIALVGIALTSTVARSEEPIVFSDGETRLLVRLDSALARRVQGRDSEGVRARVQESLRLFERVIYPMFRALVPQFGRKVSFIAEDFPQDAYHRGFVSSGPAVSEIRIDSLLLENPAAFSATAIHELQHLANRDFRPENHEETWLNEGLSQFLEYRLTGVPQDRLLNQLLASGRVPPLLDWNQGDPGQNYAASFLFVAYLYYHFGGDELLASLIASPETGIRNVESAVRRFGAREGVAPEFQRFDSLFLNFSLALGLNTRRTGISALLSLPGREFVPDLGRIRMASQFWAGRWESNLGSFESRYLKIPFWAGCVAIETEDSTRVYMLRRRGRETWIEQAGARVCSSGNEDIDLVISRFASREVGAARVVQIAMDPPGAVP